MRYMTYCTFLLLTTLIAVGSVLAGSPGDSVTAKDKSSPASSSPSMLAGGSYIAEEEPSVTLMIRASSDGGITGTLHEEGVALPLVGRREGTGFVGTVGSGDETLPFTAITSGDNVVLEIGAPDEGERLTFRPASAVGTAGSTAVSSSTTASAQRNVVINNRQLSDAEIVKAEQTYRIRIPDADYWYDRTLGAWGVKGGPTQGFIAAGLDIGGKMSPDASGGVTNIFVNGRELHAYDVMALQRITGPILPGRYFITAQGLVGYEGGPPMWDLVALTAKSQGGGGGSNTWQSGITGASGFSDGTTGAVFLPNGGIVSTGQ